MRKNIALGILSIITLISVFFTFLHARELDSLKLQVQEHRAVAERIRIEAEQLQIVAHKQQEIAEHFRMEAERKLAACAGQKRSVSFAPLQDPEADSLNRLIQTQRLQIEQNRIIAHQARREAEIQQQAVEKERAEMEKKLSDCYAKVKP
jgi:hypothetical protein